MRKILLTLFVAIVSVNAGATCQVFDKEQRKEIKNVLKELRKNNIVLASYCEECDGYKVGYKLHENGEFKIKKNRKAKAYNLLLNEEVIDVSTIYVGEDKALDQLSSIIQCGSSKFPSSINLKKIDKVRSAQRELNRRIQINEVNKAEMYAHPEVLKRVKSCREILNNNLEKGILDALKVKGLTLVEQVESDNHRRILSPLNPWGYYINLSRDIVKSGNRSDGKTLRFIDRHSFQRELKVSSSDNSATFKMFYNRHTWLSIKDVDITEEIPAQYDELGNLVRQASLKRTQYTTYFVHQEIQKTDLNAEYFGAVGIIPGFLKFEDLPVAYNIDNLETEILNLSEDYILTQEEQNLLDFVGYGLTFERRLSQRYSCGSNFNTEKIITYEVISN